MKKTYISPATVAQQAVTLPLCTTSLKLDGEHEVGGSQALTRRRWAFDDED